MQIGDRWIYEEEILSGARKRPDVSRWEQEDRTVAIQKVSEGLLVRRTVRFLNNTAPPTYIGSSSESNILVHHGCIYYVNDSASFDHGYGWDSSSSELSGSFRNDLANDKPLPDVCLPPRAGQTWGNRKVGRDLWTVAGFGRKHPDDPIAVTAKCFRLEAQLSSGDDNYVWFDKGTGIVAKRTYHNGAYYDRRLTLLRFEPGKSK